jgi:hypothetical protein
MDFAKKMFVVVCLLCGISAPGYSQSGMDESADSIVTESGKKAVADFTRDDILNLSYADLVNLPFETLIALADKLEISVEELLSMKMTVASKTGTTIREQPGILSVLSGEEIRRSGARDLVDVLRLVPGFFFGLDVNGVTGAGLRGNWGHEGKILLLQDGQEMNDLTYYIYPYGNHFPIDQIKRVEIIRGPGSSLYGGAAELGVINIITKQGADVNGLNVSATVGRFQDQFGHVLELKSEKKEIMPWDVGRLNTTISVGEQMKDLEFVVHGSLGLANRSDQKITSFYFQDYDWNLGRPEIDYANDRPTEMPSANINAGINWRDLSMRMIYDYYKTWGIDTWIYDNTYHHFLGELKYNWKLLDGKLTLTPKYNYRNMFSWGGVYDAGNIQYMRNTGSVTALYDPISWLNITGGLEGYYDYNEFILQVTGYTDDAGKPLENLFWNDKPEISFYNLAGFAQGLYRAPWGMNVTLGGRAERHSQYGYAFAPRFGLTQIIKDYHFKLLVSKAFRSPTIGALVLPFDTNTIDNPQLKPEETWVEELEAGWRINKNSFLTVNLFNIDMNKPICYFDLGTVWGYQNQPTTTGTWGVEAEYLFRHSRANVTVNYSFYTNFGKNDIPMILDGDTLGTFINVPDTVGPNLAAPQHKFGVNTSFNVWRNLWLSPTMTFMSKTSGYLTVRDEITTDDSATPEDEYYVAGIQEIGTIKPTALLNFFVTYENIVKGLTISAGVHDILGTKYPWIQPYNGYGAPIPGPSREFLLKLTYDLPVRK